MVTSLFTHERIRTTKAKAREVRRTAEKMITRAKEDSLHNRRIIAKSIKDEAVLAKLFTDIGPRFKQRAGGYTRMLKLGPRRGDASEMVLLELVERAGNEDEKAARGRRGRKSKQEPSAADQGTESASE
jgi:large subunit ribosomal protein L17